jgi:hypothetical protein
MYTAALTVRSVFLKGFLTESLDQFVLGLEDLSQIATKDLALELRVDIEANERLNNILEPI